MSRLYCWVLAPDRKIMIAAHAWWLTDTGDAGGKGAGGEGDCWIYWQSGNTNTTDGVKHHTLHYIIISYYSLVFGWGKILFIEMRSVIASCSQDSPLVLRVRLACYRDDRSHITRDMSQYNTITCTVWHITITIQYTIHDLISLYSFWQCYNSNRDYSNTYIQYFNPTLLSILLRKLLFYWTLFQSLIS